MPRRRSTRPTPLSAIIWQIAEKCANQQPLTEAEQLLLAKERARLGLDQLEWQFTPTARDRSAEIEQFRRDEIAQASRYAKPVGNNKFVAAMTEEDEWNELVVVETVGGHDPEGES